MRKLSHQEIVARQIERMRQGRLPFHVVLDNIRSLENVGSIFRTADAVGIQKLWLCGITGYPPQGGIRKTALGAEDHVEWEYQSDAAAVVKSLKEKGFQIIVLEQADASQSVELCRPRAPFCLVIGYEVDGVSQAVCDLADVIVEIDMAGVKNSLNVSVAFGVAAYSLKNNLTNR